MPEKDNRLQTASFEAMRHTLAHILMQALRRLYPDATPGVGPAIEDGFYHDFDCGTKISEADLPKIEEEMRKIIKENLPIVKEVLPVDEGISKLKRLKYPNTLELAQDLKKEGYAEISFYSQGEFTNMCKGPHVESTGQVGAFKLVRIAGAYWKGDEKNKMLQRIYGYALASQKELDDYLLKIEEAKRRDHRVLGKDLDLFTFADLVGKGLPLWTPKGSVIRRELERFVVDEEIKRGYLHVFTPELAKVDLYKTSGHFPYYKETMYPVMKIDEDELILRPMTCPHHFMLYADKVRSYRDLPIRFAELAKLFRYEKSGELTGLMRVRSFCLADAHIICRMDQAAREIHSVLDFIEFVTKTLGLEKGDNYVYRLSLGDRGKPEKYYKDDAMWDHSEGALRSVLKERNAPFYEAAGEAAFYGPKIDIQMKNVLGKEETAFTVQYDFCMPSRFKLKYINEKGQEEQPVVVHRSSIGALERVIAFLIEFYGGNFPLWLSPAQVKVMPVGKDHVDFAKSLHQRFQALGIRAELDDDSETVGKKIRQAEKERVPYMLVVGDKEKSSNILNIRIRGQKDTININVEEFIIKVQKEIKEKVIF